MSFFQRLEAARKSEGNNEKKTNPKKRKIGKFTTKKLEKGTPKIRVLKNYSPKSSLAIKTT